jgi:hypothetical protein
MKKIPNRKSNTIQIRTGNDHPNTKRNSTETRIWNNYSNNKKYKKIHKKNTKKYPNIRIWKDCPNNKKTQQKQELETIDQIPKEIQQK